MLPNEMYEKIAFSMKYRKAIRIGYWIHLKTSKINEKNKFYRIILENMLATVTSMKFQTSLDDYLKKIPKAIVKNIAYTKLKKDVLEQSNTMLKRYGAPQLIKNYNYPELYLYSHALFTKFLIDGNLKGMRWMLKNKMVQDRCYNYSESYTQIEFDVDPSYDVIKLFMKYDLYDWDSFHVSSSWYQKDKKLFELIWGYTKKMVNKSIRTAKNKGTEKQHWYNTLIDGGVEDDTELFKIVKEYLKKLKNN